ncbi:hypothetical protein AURDEDRAFT_150072 [Auricularia subglabra TFB-10046 SS5]|nr:hypothetical protein AURDEDRAFT_150072 [Auricularia subglabra TFB-10046 SS5]
MAFDPAIVDDLPAELLHAVFVILAMEPDPYWPNTKDATYNYGRARQPYHLAALMLGRPLPLLEDLCLCLDEADNRIDISWLPHAPSLRKLCSPTAQFNFPAAASAATIVYAGLHVSNSTAAGFLDTLRQMPLLESLCFESEDDMDEPWPAPNGNVVALNALQSLELRRGWTAFGRFLSLRIAAPKLCRLNLSPEELCHPESLRRFSHAYPSIIDLRIEGFWAHGDRLAYHDGLSLHLFEHIKYLSINNCTIEERFFYRMDGLGTAYRGLPWPELEAFRVSYQPRSRDGRSLQDLALFISRRSSVYRLRQRTFTVTIEEWPSPFPSWFRRALGALVGPANVRLTSGGVIYDAVGDSDEEEEEEAQFTDSNEGSIESDGDDEISEVSSGESEGACIHTSIWDTVWDTDSDDTEYVDGDEA